MKTSPNTAVPKGKGIVAITQCRSLNLEVPVVNTIEATYQGERACVLARTNYDASQALGLLNKSGIPAKLIQSTDGFRFGNLAEVRFFLKAIDKGLQSPVISEERWENAKSKTLDLYGRSACIDYIREFFEAFESTNRTKYRSDLADFVFESSLEDFCTGGQSTISMLKEIMPRTTMSCERSMWV